MKAVVVTTKNRGVFFGYTECSLLDERVVLERMRNCIFWHKSVGGVFGLASRGPNAQCKIGAQVPGKTGLVDVSSISECTPEAEAAWLAAPITS